MVGGQWSVASAVAPEESGHRVTRPPAVERAISLITRRADERHREGPSTPPVAGER